MRCVRRSLISPVVLAALAFACSGRQKPAEQPSPGQACQKAIMGYLQNPELREISGIDESLVQPGVFWVHNDSGEASARIFAIDAQGDFLWTYALDGATNVDWEDLSVGPCSGGQGSCIFLADSGNNEGDRTVFDLYQVREPEAFATPDLTAARIRFRYDSGRGWNAEAFAVDPTTGSRYLVRKTKDASKTLYKFPPDGEIEPLTLLPVCHFSGLGEEQITAVDIHPGGRRLLLRTYEHIFEYEASAIDDPAICSNRVREIAHFEAQGEAIAYVGSGDGFVTASEAEHQPLYRFTCGK